jgi:putative membrane protein
MQRWTQALAGAAIAATIVACGNDNPNDYRAADRDQGAAVGTAGSGADVNFIRDQLEDGRAEIQLGQLATERATHPQVKQFAQMMVHDHQMAGDELKQAAAAASVPVDAPAEPDGDHRDVHEELLKLTGRDFDRKYIDTMVKEHEEAVNELEAKQDAENMQVRQWASKTLPKVREHLEQAKQIQNALEKQ